MKYSDGSPVKVGHVVMDARGTERCIIPWSRTR